MSRAHSGLFVTFEGIDGCGKTSQLAALASRLRSRGVDPVETREPGGTVAGNAIRELLLRPMSPPLVSNAELHLFAAARAQHVCELIRPALEQGRLVLCDRYVDATLAYQGHGRGLSVDLIRELNRLATDGLQPDVTIVVALPVEIALRRIFDRSGQGEPPSRFDMESIAFHERVQYGYELLARNESARVRVVNGIGSLEEVAARIDNELDPVIQQWLSRN